MFKHEFYVNGIGLYAFIKRKCLAYAWCKWKGNRPLRGQDGLSWELLNPPAWQRQGCCSSASPGPIGTCALVPNSHVCTHTHSTYVTWSSTEINTETTVLAQTQTAPMAWPCFTSLADQDESLFVEYVYVNIHTYNMDAFSSWSLTFSLCSHWPLHSRSLQLLACEPWLAVQLTAPFQLLVLSPAPAHAMDPHSIFRHLVYPAVDP